jgi:hypothetical protein
MSMSMFIKYVPTRKRDQLSARPQSTNLGDFKAGQVGGPYISDRDIRWAKELVANGEFIASDPSGEPLSAAPATEQAEGAATPAPKKKPTKKKATKNE